MEPGYALSNDRKLIITVTELAPGVDCTYEKNPDCEIFLYKSLVHAFGKQIAKIHAYSSAQ